VRHGPSLFLSWGTFRYLFNVKSAKVHPTHTHVGGGIFMKSLMKYGLAAAMVFATAMPAMARSWVVCVDQSQDARFSTETSLVGTPPAATPNFFVGAGAVYGGGTDVSNATACTPAGVNRPAAIGTFFAFGGLVAGLPQSITADTNDLFYVVWHFRINGAGIHGAGAFDTTGIVRGTSTYPQTITGSTNPGLVPTHGKATVTNLTNGTSATTKVLLTFRITTP
jgi:hypothetical protein